ncbi:MAG: radical SAM/SPASM domain-containing protein [Thermoanaerobaculia bacterium]
MNLSSLLSAVRSSRPEPRFLEKKREAVQSFLDFDRGGERPKYPIEIYLEVSNVCDLKCVMCPTFSAFNPARKQAIWDTDPGFLETDPATLALGPLLERALVVHAFGYGEPTIHPSFPAFLQHVSNYEVLIDFFTNGMHLTEELVRQLVDLSIFQITVSFSGASAELYENVYQGGNFERVLSGLARLRDAKAAAGSVFPRVAVNSLSFDHHVRELDAFVDLMARHGVERVAVTRLFEHNTALPQLKGHAANFDSPEIREAVARARDAAARNRVTLALHPFLESDLVRAVSDAPDRPAGENLLPVREFKEIAGGLPVLPRGADSGPRGEAIDLARDSPGTVRRRLLVGSPPGTGGDRPFYCMEPFKTFYLRRGGKVKTCCYMVDGAPAVGDIGRATGEQIWNGVAYETMRGSILNGQYPLAACGACLSNRQAPATHGVGLMVRNYVAWSGVEPRAPIDEHTASWLERSTGADIVDRLFAKRADTLALPDSDARAKKIVALLGEDLSWSASLEGWVDHVSEQGVAGWVRSPLFPDVRLPVALWIGERKVAESVARSYRPDLYGTGRGDGRYGFSFPRRLSEREMRDAEVRIGNSPYALERTSTIPGA